MKDIKIYPVLNGFVVKVGCQKIVFTSLAELTKELKRYYGAKNPSEIDKDWEENSINSGKDKNPAGFLTGAGLRVEAVTGTLNYK